MKIGNVDISKEVAMSLVETYDAYTQELANIKNMGVSYPERALKALVKEIDESTEVEETTALVEGDISQFSTYYNIGRAAGCEITEIQEAFDNQDVNFLVESSFYNNVTQKIKSMKDMGHKVNNISVTTRGGVPHAEFITIDKEKNRKRHIIHGNTQSVSNLGKVDDRDPDAMSSGI